MISPFFQTSPIRSYAKWDVMKVFEFGSNFCPWRKHSSLHVLFFFPTESSPSFFNRQKKLKLTVTEIQTTSSINLKPTKRALNPGLRCHGVYFFFLLLFFLPVCLVLSWCTRYVELNGNIELFSGLESDIVVTQLPRYTSQDGLDKPV